MGSKPLDDVLEKQPSWCYSSSLNPVNSVTLLVLDPIEFLQLLNEKSFWDGKIISIYVE